MEFTTPCRFLSSPEQEIVPALKYMILLVVVCLVCRYADASDPHSPNIVVILVDDMGNGNPGCFNSQSKIPTPNIDSLARDLAPPRVISPQDSRYSPQDDSLFSRIPLIVFVIPRSHAAEIDPARVTPSTIR